MLEKVNLVNIQLTRLCNLSCKHCFIENKKEKGLLVQSEGLLLKLKTSLNELKPQILGLSGGEPFLFPKVIYSLLSSLSFKPEVRINTNGTWNLESLEVLKLLELLNEMEGTLIFSLDGLKTTHEKIRGKNTFNKTFSSILRVKKISLKSK